MRQPSFLDIVGLLIGFGGATASFLFSLASGNGEWFQRSGSLLVLFSVLVEIRQALRNQPYPRSSVTSGGNPVMTQAPISVVSKWLHWIARSGIVLGTAIWGYGDLVF